MTKRCEYDLSWQSRASSFRKLIFRQGDQKMNRSLVKALKRITAHRVSPEDVWDHIEETQTNRETIADADFKELIMSLEWELTDLSLDQLFHISL